MLKTNTEKGFTMISLVVTSVVISMMVIALIAVSKQDVFDAQLDNSAATVHALHAATKKYYDTHCNDASFIQPTPSTLVTDGLLSGVTKVMLYNSNIPTITIANVGLKNVSFRYVYTFTKQYEANRVSDTSSYATANGTQVTWLYRNHALENDSLSYNHELLNAFGVNYC